MNTDHQKRIFKQAAKISLVLFGAGVLILWAWNTTMTTLFGLPSIQFKEAVGLMILVGMISFIFRGGQHRMIKHTKESTET